MPRILRTCVEFNTTATDRLTWAVGEDWGTIGTGQTRAIHFGLRLNNRSFQGQPNIGTIVSQAAPTTQIGWNLDCGDGSREGICRFALVASAGSPMVLMVSMPGPGVNQGTVMLTNNGSNSWTATVYWDGLIAGTKTQTMGGSVSSGTTDIVFGARSTASEDHLNNCSIARARLYNVALSASDVTTIYSGGRLQDSNGPTPIADVWMGSGYGDNATTFLCQLGSGKDASLTGTWATKGVVKYNTFRKMGTRKTLSGTATTGWVDVFNTSISSGAQGVTLTSTSTDIRSCARNTSYASGSEFWKARVVIQVPTTGTHILSFAVTPLRTNAIAFMCLLNLIGVNEGVMSMYAGEFSGTFGDAEVLRSTVPSDTGTSPTTPNSDRMVNTGAAANDQIEFVVEMMGNVAMFKARNLTANGPYCRMVVTLNNEAPDGPQNAPPSPYYLSVGNVVSGTSIQVISIKFEDHTIEKPRKLLVSDSITSVDADDWADTVVPVLNELLIADGQEDNDFDVWGCPGSRLLDIYDMSVLTGDLEAIGSRDAVCIICGANDYGASGLSTAVTRLTTLVNHILGWATPPRQIILIAYPPHTAGGVTAEQWLDELDTLAASNPTMIKVISKTWDDAGDPPGTNNQLAGDYDDSIHLNTTGLQKLAQRIKDSGAIDMSYADGSAQAFGLASPSNASLVMKSFIADGSAFASDATQAQMMKSFEAQAWCFAQESTSGLVLKQAEAYAAGGSFDSSLGSNLKQAATSYASGFAFDSGLGSVLKQADSYTNGDSYASTTSSMLKQADAFASGFTFDASIVAAVKQAMAFASGFAYDSSSYNRFVEGGVAAFGVSFARATGEVTSGGEVDEPTVVAWCKIGDTDLIGESIIGETELLVDD